MSLAPAGATPQRAAFTLLELLAVITLIAVLTGIVIGASRHAVRTGRVARAKAELAVMSAALESYRRVHGDYPHADDGAQLLSALLGRRGPASEALLVSRPVFETTRFTVLDSRLIDPWGQPYVYAYKMPPGGWTNPQFVLYSRGPDEIAFSRLTTGGFPDASADGNADNIHAGR